ncbi:MAG: hypothetical protein IK056_07360, partial [Clostridia bacterium]|nr:hypothetical protein [Clostridia bacterium]
MRILLAEDNIRLRFGAEKLADALGFVGISGDTAVSDTTPSADEILVCVRENSRALSELEKSESVIYHIKAPEGEAFQLETCAGGG